MGSKGIVASTAAMAVLLQEGIGDTIRVSLTPEPGGDRTREVVVAQEILQTMGLRSFTPMVTACPGCGRTTSTTFQELAESIQAYLRAQMPVWRARYPGVEAMQVAVMGCVVNGPGESKLANIGISLPGTGETPVAPVYVDGEKTVTLQGRAHRRGVPADRRRLRARDLRRRAARRAPRSRDARSIAAQGARVGYALMAATTASRPRHERRAARRGGRCGSSSRTPHATCSAQYGYRNMRVPIVEPTRAVRARHRRCDRHRREGDVHVRGQAERREPDAASRGDRRHRPRRDRAQPHLRAAAARVDRGPDVPPRAPAEGPLPAVPPVRRRGAGLRRARTSTPSRSSCSRGCGSALGLDDGIALHDQLDRRRRRAARASRRARRLFRAPRGRSRRRREAPAATPIRCASSTARIRRCRR